MFPKVKNKGRFKGISFYTADWPWEDVDIPSIKVAVIGTVASGVQVVQEI